MADTADLGVRLLGVGRIHPVPGWNTPRHQHDHHELIVVEGGRMRVVFDDAECTVGAGQILFYAAGDHHTEISDPKQPVSTRFTAFVAELGHQPLPRLVEDRLGRVRMLVTWLEEDWRSLDRSGLNARPILAEALLTEWRRQALLHPEPVLERVHNHIATHLAEPIAVGDLAVIAGMSLAHFIRSYRGLTGRTPMAEVRRARLEVARHLVATSDLPLREIPGRVGLATVQHLTRLFRKHFGITPGAMRARREAVADSTRPLDPESGPDR